MGTGAGSLGVNTQDWALFWPKVDRKLGIVGCSLFGLGTDERTGRKDCIAWPGLARHCIGLQPGKDAALCFFFFSDGAAAVRAEVEGVLLHQFMVEFWCPLSL